MNCAWLIGSSVLEAAFLPPAAAFFFSGRVGCLLGAIAADKSTDPRQGGLCCAGDVVECFDCFMNVVMGWARLVAQDLSAENCYAVHAPVQLLYGVESNSYDASSMPLIWHLRVFERQL